MRRFATIVLLLIVFSIGAAGGAWISVSRRAADFAAGVDRRLAESAHATPMPVADGKRVFFTDDEMLTSMMSALAEDEPLLRAHRLHDLFARLSSAELGVLFQRVLRVEDRDRRGLMLEPLLARWAALDLASASAAVRPFVERFRAEGGADWRSLDTAVSQAWAETVPDAALADAMAAPNAPWASWTAASALNALGDAERRLDLLTHFPATRLRAQLAENVIRDLATTDYATAERYLDLVSDPWARARVHSEILGKLAERDPSAALARLAALAPDLKPGAKGTLLVDTVFRAVAKQDTAAAFAALDQLPPALHDNALGALLVGWAEKDPVAALEWASANGVDVAQAKSIMQVSDMGGSWQSLIMRATQSDRAKTLDWLRAQPASPARDAMFRDAMWSFDGAEKNAEIYAELTPEGRAGAAWRMIESLYKEGADRAQAWVNDLPAGDARSAAVEKLVARQIQDAPEQWATLPDAWSAGPDRDAALDGIVHSLSNSDPRRALDFARRIADPATREIALEDIARSWLNRDKQTARAWIASAAELSAEQKRVIFRQFDER